MPVRRIIAAALATLGIIPWGWAALNYNASASLMVGLAGFVLVGIGLLIGLSGSGKGGERADG